MVRTRAGEVLVVDSWPVMEWFRDRTPAAGHFQEILDQAACGECRLLMSVVNMGEVFYSIAKLTDAGTAERVIETLGRLRIDTVSIDDDLVWRAARLKAAYSVAYGDAFAAALAIRESAPLLTGDTEFHAMETARLLQVEWM